MRRIAAIGAALLAVALLLALPALGDDGGPYRVRAIFDNGSFVVPDEEVRVAGARVGRVESVDVSREDEIVSLEDGPHPVPGKAVVVLEIEDDTFKDFRTDASCLIRPQSLIGEKFIDCTPTQPRAPGSPPPPELEEIPEGEPGEGQLLLPLENNGKTVDLDLIQNIQRMPFRDRFRLILNDLGAGLAARGKDLGEVIDRANPALRQTNRVLRILALQSRQLESLASDGDTVLDPLARNRTSVTGFFRNAGVAAEATAERRGELEEGLQKLPATLRQVRLTMSKLRQFADQGTPLMADLRVAAPNLSKATQKLGPFAAAGTPALQTLGSAAQAAGPKLVAADPVLRSLHSAAAGLTPGNRGLSALLDTLRRTDGVESLMDFIYNSLGTVNGFDQFGHFLRGNLQVTNCFLVEEVVVPGCEAFFRDVATPKQKKKKKKKSRKRSRKAGKKATRQNRSGGIDYSPQATPLPPQIPALPQIQQILPPLDDPTPPQIEPPSPQGIEPTPEQTKPTEPRGGVNGQARRMSMQQANAFLRYLLGSGA